MLVVNRIAVDDIYVPTARRKTLHPKRRGCLPKTFSKTA